VQESYHPLHANIGGMAITHMASVLHLANSEGASAIFRMMCEKYINQCWAILNLNWQSTKSPIHNLFWILSSDTFLCITGIYASALKILEGLGLSTDFGEDTWPHTLIDNIKAHSHILL
jgi:hypothetical protein